MFTEVKEMINSTIYENGKGEVTAQNVNLAMQGIVEATEEVLTEVKDGVATLEDRVKNVEENGTGGGSQTIVVYVGLPEETEEGEVLSLTPEEKAHNAEAFKAIKESRGSANIFIDMTRFQREVEEANKEEGTEIIDLFNTAPVMLCNYYHMIMPEQEVEMVMLYCIDYAFYMVSDGSISAL